MCTSHVRCMRLGMYVGNRLMREGILSCPTSKGLMACNMQAVISA